MAAIKTYIGTKIIRATPMTRAQFVSLKGEIAQEHERLIDHQDEYMVRFSDGYESWSPKAAFEGAYREITRDEINQVAHAAGFYMGEPETK